MSTKHEPSNESRRIVEDAAGLGLPHPQIGRLLRIGDDTLRKHYREELDRGMATANLAVARSLFEAATVEKNVTAMIFWAKTRLRWAPPPHEEVVRLSAAPPAPTWAQLRPSLVTLAEGSEDPEVLAQLLLKLRRLDKLEAQEGNHDEA